MPKTLGGQGVLLPDHVDPAQRVVRLGILRIDGEALAEALDGIVGFADQKQLALKRRR